MKMLDLVIVGGGMVGLALASALRNSGLRIAVVDKKLPSDITADAATRVSALNLASERFLSRIGAWPLLSRKQYFSAMSVWERDSFAHFDVDASQFEQQHLGHIVENNVVQQALLATLQDSAVELLIPAQIQSVSENEQGIALVLDNQQMLFTRLLVAADGANSQLRQQFRIPLTSWDYQQTALVATIRTAEPHQQVARQVFTPEGPLAFLPLWQDNLCSIVWSLPSLLAEDLASCQEAEFNHRLAATFDMKLGLCELVSARELCPLTARYARQQVQSRLILLGDAAHTIHPLAGQGVNLGFMDAAALSDTLQQMLAQGIPVDDARMLRRYERWRKAEAVQWLATMEGFKRLFSGDDPIKKLIRGTGMRLAEYSMPLMKPLLSKALGTSGELPESTR
ncbi:FAD-dependent monooxygenase [Tolumonas osonensis]|uniref:2-octaprenylphenol hydroxylase n=1 Tax=Tolumonas osonensis TaxID=675874 RepID=A0A841GPA1_9GAMM|nr:FAD-dependent monooxygenase [Tolumonas osonensis]MBB6056312.1 2-octaprenylphenol hydroxylase [Tolumonas osonensis]